MLLTAVVACGPTAPRNGACTSEGLSALVLRLEDSVTGAKFPFSDVVAVATDGAFRDSVRIAEITDAPPAPNIGGFGMVRERAGTYSVTVRATGYSPWTKSGVVVRADACHVIGETLAVKLRGN
jgi:hypothetical protein